MKTKSPQEYLSDDILDENFIKCFAPIHFVQRLLGSSQVDIRYNFVTSRTLLQKLYTCLWVILATFSLVHFELHYYRTYYDVNLTLYLTCSFGIFAQYVSYVVNAIHQNFVNNNEIVKLYVMLQKIDRVLQLSQFKSLNNNQYYMNLVLLLIIMFGFVSGFITFVCFEIEHPEYTMFLGLGLFSIYIDILLTGSFIYYLAVRIEVVSGIIVSQLLKDTGVKKKYIFFQTEYHVGSVINDLKGPLDLPKYTICLRDILKAFRTINSLYSFSVFNITCTVFIWTFLVIEAMAVGKQTKLFSNIAIVENSLWIMLYFELLMSLAITSDLFISQVDSIKSICIHSLSVYPVGEHYKMSKSLLQLIEDQPPEFSVYDIFIMNKTMPLKLIGIITTNVVVLIQFTLGRP